MKFKVRSASNTNQVRQVEINTLEELLEFVRENGEDTIVERRVYPNKEVWTLFIYEGEIK